jgi:hypothetical protein
MDKEQGQKSNGQGASGGKQLDFEFWNGGAIPKALMCHISRKLKFADIPLLTSNC